MLTLLFVGVPILVILVSDTTSIGKTGEKDRQFRLITSVVFLIVMIVGLLILKYDIFKVGFTLKENIVDVAKIVGVFVVIFSYTDFRDGVREKYDTPKRDVFTKCLVTDVLTVRTFSKQYYLSCIGSNGKIRFTFRGGDVDGLLMLRVRYTDEVIIEYYPSTKRILYIDKVIKPWKF